jgi:hypothetical protein
MAANIHYRAVEEDFEIAERIEPVRIDVTAAGIENKNSRKGLLKLSLSITYFFVLVYFLVKLLV